VIAASYLMPSGPAWCRTGVTTSGLVLTLLLISLRYKASGAAAIPEVDR